LPHPGDTRQAEPSAVRYAKYLTSTATRGTASAARSSPQSRRILALAGKKGRIPSSQTLAKGCRATHPDPSLLRRTPRFRTLRVRVGGIGSRAGRELLSGGSRCPHRRSTSRPPRPRVPRPPPRPHPRAPPHRVPRRPHDSPPALALGDPLPRRGPARQRRVPWIARGLPTSITDYCWSRARSTVVLPRPALPTSLPLCMSQAFDSAGPSPEPPPSLWNAAEPLARPKRFCHGPGKRNKADPKTA
jgi:hypothetical protein